MTALRDILVGEGADRVVPRTGLAARLTAFTSATMAFLAVFALALSLASGRLADRWSAALAGTATIRLSVPEDQREAQTKAVLDILAVTPGVASARALPQEDQRKLLEPWFGPDLPVERLALPQLIEITAGSPPFDAEGLRQRLAGETPGAVLDDHDRWRAPLARAAVRLRTLGFLAFGLILGAMGAMITLGASASLAANLGVIRVLRLVGAEDAYIARAFVRRFTLRAFGGALAGSIAGTLALAAVPSAGETAGLLPGLGFEGAGWLWPLALPPIAAIIAFAATRVAAFRKLKELT